MKQMIYQYILLVAFICLSQAAAIAICTAQDRVETDSLLSKIAQWYEKGFYLDAELEGRRLLEQSGLRDSVRVQIEKYIAFSLIVQEKPQQAASHFTALLQIDSTFNLDPQLTSPKILTVFRQTRDKFFAEDATVPERLLPPASHLQISYRAMLFPGWEQLYQGKKGTGYIFLTVGAASLLSTLYCDFRRRDLRDSYLSAETTELAVERYRTYNNYQKAEIYSGAIFVLTYIASEVEIFAFGTNEVISHTQLIHGKEYNAVNIKIPF